MTKPHIANDCWCGAEKHSVTTTPQAIEPYSPGKNPFHVYVKNKPLGTDEPEIIGSLGGTFGLSEQSVRKMRETIWTRPAPSRRRITADDLDRRGE